MTLYSTFDHYATPLGPDGTPYRYFEALRDEAISTATPIGWSEAHGGFWVVTGWEESKSIQANTTDFSNSAVTFPQYATPSGKPFMLSGQDEPEHSRYRKMVQAPFTRPRAQRMLGQMREIARHIVDGVVGRDRMDVCEATDLMPGYAFCAIAGLSMEDAPRYRRFVAAMVDGATHPESAAPAIREMGEYFSGLIRQRRRAPADGLIDELIRTEFDGQRLDDEELLEFCTVLLLGGFDNTLRLLGNVFYRLAATPELRHRLASNPALIPSAVDEFMRLDAPAMTFRKVVNDVSVAGIEMTAGQIAGLIHPVCNRDPRQFPDPDRFSIERQPNRHMTFGFGVHHCLGAFLAQVEAVAMIEQFLARIPEFELDPHDPAHWIVGQVGGMTRVPILCRPAR